MIIFYLLCLLAPTEAESKIESSPLENISEIEEEQIEIRSLDCCTEELNDLPEKYQCICEKTQDAEQRQIACPKNYCLYAESCGRFCYRYESSDCQNWNNARMACRAEGGDLLVPSECNYEFFRAQALQDEGKCGEFYWLGARLSFDGTSFITVRGDPISDKANFWGILQPNNDGNCLEMSSNLMYKANDVDCNFNQRYICQILI